MKPNEKWVKFAQSYATGKTATQACRDAGYEGTDGSLYTQGSRLLRNEKVISLIKEITGPAMEAGIIDAKEWLRLCSDATKNAKNEFARFKGLELLGRYFSLFVEKNEVTIKTPEIHIESHDGNKLFKLTVSENTPAQIPAASDTEPGEGH